MRLINQACEAFIQEPGLPGIYKQIERAGRTCYKSTDKITEESAKPFVDRMINSNHTAMLEHGTVYLKVPAMDINDLNSQAWGMRTFYRGNSYSRCVTDADANYYITTNFRVIVENRRIEDLQYICEPTEYHIKRYTLSCTTALHCYKDLTRHRTLKSWGILR